MPDDNRPWLKTIPILNTDRGKEIANEFCDKYGFSMEQLYGLLEAKVGESGRSLRRRGLFDDFDQVFGEGDDHVD